jgi:hypothetical protein
MTSIAAQEWKDRQAAFKEYQRVFNYTLAVCGEGGEMKYNNDRLLQGHDGAEAGEIMKRLAKRGNIEAQCKPFKGLPPAIIKDLETVVDHCGFNMRQIRSDVKFVKENIRKTTMLNNGKSIFKKALYAWRTAWAGAINVEPVDHTKDVAVINRTLRFPSGLAIRRAKSGVPWVVTDRLVLTFENDEGPHVGKLLRDGIAYRCKYIEPKDFAIIDGYLAVNGPFYGCAARDYDARKAASMKAVQHVKRTIGVL